MYFNHIRAATTGRWQNLSTLIMTSRLFYMSAQTAGCLSSNERVSTCVNLEVHPEVAGVAEGLAAVFTLMRFHPNVPHEVHIELSGRNKSSGTHAALELLLAHVALTFHSGGDV